VGLALDKGVRILGAEMQEMYTSFSRSQKHRKQLQPQGKATAGNILKDLMRRCVGGFTKLSFV
jgi:hypothetical protein